MAKPLEKVAAMACMTVLLMLFNFAFFCSGLLMLCVGIYMKLELQEYADLGLDNSGAALLALSCLGALVALVGILACCCTTRQHPALLYLYGAFLAVIALLELGAGASVYTYRNSLIEGFDRGLNESLNAYGVDKSKTKHVDIMQEVLHCCGNRHYTDWANMVPSKPIPDSCCAVPKGECDVADVEDLNTQGCYNKVIYFIKSHVGLVAGSALGVAVFPMLGVFLACCLASYINKKQQQQAPKIRSDQCRQVMMYRGGQSATPAGMRLPSAYYYHRLQQPLTPARSSALSKHQPELVLDLRRLQLRSLNAHHRGDLSSSSTTIPSSY